MGSITRPPPDMSCNELAPQSQDETYRPQSRGATPVIENVRVAMGQQQMNVVTHDTLQRQVQEYCQKNKAKRKQEWESHRTALEEFRRHKDHNRYGNKVKIKGMPHMLKCCRTLNRHKLL